MPTGQPDYASPSYKQTSGIGDLTNAFAFLMGFSPMDLSGRVRYVDTFQWGLRAWSRVTFGTGTSPTVEINSPYVFTGNGSANFVSTAVNDRSMIWKYFYNYSTTRWGVEVGFRMSADICTVRVNVNYLATGGTGYQCLVRANRVTNKIQLYNGSTYTDVADLSLVSGSFSSWGAIKIVGDWATGKFVRLIVNGRIVDLSSISMPADVTAQTGILFLDIGNEKTAAGDGSKSNIGYVILTEDEP